MISVTAAVPVASIVNDSEGGERAVMRAAFVGVTATDIENLVSKLENGGEFTLTEKDIVALDKLLDKLDNMEASDILDYVDKNGSEMVKQASAGMTEEAIDEARDAYTTQLKELQYQVAEAQKDASGNAVVTIEKPVMMTVSVNLQNYLDKAMEQYSKPEAKDKVIEKLSEKLGLPTDKLDNAALNDIYALSAPDKFMTKSGRNRIF